MSGALLPFFKNSSSSCEVTVLFWRVAVAAEVLEWVDESMRVDSSIVDRVCLSWVINKHWHTVAGTSPWGFRSLESVSKEIYIFLVWTKVLREVALKKYLYTVEYSRLILDDPGTEPFIVASRSRDLHEKFNSESVSLPSPLQGSPTSFPHTGIPPTCASSNIFEDI